MHIIEIDRKNKKHIEEFIRLPFRLYSDNPRWVPPFRGDMLQFFDEKNNPFYKHSEAAFFLVYREIDHHPVGRIAVINQRRYNQYNNERTAFFYLFECEADPEAAHALIERVVHWARQKGLDTILGPKGFTALNGTGLLVQGFEHRPAMGIPYNPEYYLDLIEKNGFETAYELVSGHLDYGMEFPERIHRASALIQKRRNLKILSFRNRRELRPVIAKIKDLYNGSLAGSRYNAPITDNEAQSMANQLLWFADPGMIKIIAREGEPVGFLLAYPDISAAIQRTNGRMLPFGWADMLLELRRTPWININGAGILEEYRGLGGTAILFSEMYNSAAGRGQYRYADLVQVGTENDEMQREMRNFGIKIYKKHRVYIQRLRTI